MSARTFSRSQAVAALAASVVVGYGAARFAPLVVVPLVCLFVAVTIAASWSSSRAPRVHQTPRPGEPAAAGIKPVWWLAPGWAAAIGIAPGILLATLVPAGDFLADWRTPKYFDDSWLLVSLALAAAFLIGMLLASGLRGSSRGGEPPGLRLSQAQRLRLLRGSQVLFWLTVVGYAAWTAVAIARGLRSGDVLAIVSGTPEAGDHVKNTYLSEVAGVTTLTQFGPVAVAGFYLLHHLDPRRRGYWPYIGVLLALGAGRAVLHAERLALIELVVPLVVLGVALRPVDRTRPTVWHGLRATARNLFPVILPLLAVVVFGVFEYSRSWSYYRDHGSGDSYIGFTVDRLGGYYATATNNSVLLLDSDTRQAEIPYYTIEWLWDFPLVSDVIPYDGLAGTHPPTALADTLEANANPEFNNPGGLLLPAYDLGIAGAGIFWLVVGVGVGATYLRFRAGDPRAVLLYAVGFVGLLEASRFVYWTQGRAFPSLVAAVALGAYVRTSGAATQGAQGRSASRSPGVTANPRTGPRPVPR